MYAHSADLDQMLHSGTSNLSLHCLSMSHKKYDTPIRAKTEHF